MKIDMIDLRLSDDRKIFNKLQPIINENNGNLKITDLFNELYIWTHLFLVKVDSKIVGFAIIRRLSKDEHNTGFDEYYYISDMVLLKKQWNKGYGTKLLKEVVDSIKDLPLVTSVKKDKDIVTKILKKEMMIYSEQDNIYRFMDKEHYELRGDTISFKFRL